MSQQSDAATVGLDYYGFVLRRQWLVVVGGLALGGLAALVLFSAYPLPVKATAVVNLSVISTDPFNTSKQASNLLDGTTEAQIATSYTVAADAAKKMGFGSTPDEVRRNLEVESQSGASIVRLTYAAPTSERARAGADAIATSYLDYRTTRAQTKLDSILHEVEARRTDLGTQLADANSRISEAGAGTLAASQAVSDRDLVTIELNALLSQKGALEQVDTEGGEVITEAAHNDVAQPSLGQWVLIGLLAGAIVGIVVAFAVNRFDRRMRGADEARRATDAPVLADVHSVVASIPHDETTLELLRTARERILADLPQGAQVIAIVDDTPPELHADISAELALVTANSGVPTTLVLPQPAPGLRHALRTALELEDPRPGDDREACRSALASRLTVSFPSAGAPVIVKRRAGEVYFVVIGQGASPSSALAALRLSDALVLVAVKHRTRADDARQVLEEASRLAVSFLGTVLVPRNRTAIRPHHEDPAADQPAADTAEAVSGDVDALLPIAEP